jgi:small GTP-binding protein
MDRRSLQSRMNAEDSMVQNKSMQTEIYNYFKIILLGNVSVGKTSILRQFTDSIFNDTYSCTISADNKVKSILIDHNTWVEMNIWDTAGQERYRTITRQFYKHAKGNIY